MLRPETQLGSLEGFWVFPGGQVDEADMEAAAAARRSHAWLIRHGRQKSPRADESDRALGIWPSESPDPRMRRGSGNPHRADSSDAVEPVERPARAVKRFNTAISVAVADTLK